jgi:hypothetical protein
VKRCVGPRIYVEWDELVEVLMDGATLDWRPILGLPKSEVPARLGNATSQVP